MSKKVLPISYPMITSWQWHATLFSIIGDEEKAKNWIFSNYIQLRCYNIEEIFTGDEMLLADMMPGSSSLKECPYLLFSLLTKEQVESYCGDMYTEYLTKPRSSVIRVLTTNSLMSSSYTDTMMRSKNSM